jgi:hypothetical protein
MHGGPRSHAFGILVSANNAAYRDSEFVAIATNAIPDSLEASILLAEDCLTGPRLVDARPPSLFHCVEKRKVVIVE